MKNTLKKWFLEGWINGVLLLACLVLGGGISLFLGRDVSLEPLAHTLYPAHALWAARWGTDVFACAAGPVLNPLLFLPYYLIFVKLNSWPFWTLFLNGFPYGLFLFFMWKTFSLAFEKQGRLVACVFVALGVSGLAALAAVGGGSGALWLAALEAWACLLLFYGKTPRARQGAFFWASFAVGLSISALPVWIGLLAASLVWRAERKSSRVSCAAWSLCGFLASLSVAVLSAWGMGTLDELGTFFYPAGWAFGAPSWAVRWEMPVGFWEWFLLPVWRLRYALEGYRVDPRVLFGLISAVILLGKRCFGTADKRETAWSVLWLAAYGVWLVGFRDAASSVLLEGVGVLLLGRVLVWLLGARGGMLGAAVLLWVVFPPVMPQGRQGVEDCNFAFFKEPVLEEKPLILLSGHVSGWAAFLPQEARYAGGIWFDPHDYPVDKEFVLQRLNPLPSGYYSHRHDGAVLDAVRAHDGAVYAVLPKEENVDHPAVWRRYGVELAEPVSQCQELYPAQMVGVDVFLLCRLRKLPAEK